MTKKTLDFLLRVHTLPRDLQRPLADARFQATSELYQRVIDSRLLWKVWMIDMFGKVWIEVDFENDQGEDEFHTLAIDEGTYRKVECDPYEALFEDPKT
jgi:hypothetical protein